MFLVRKLRADQFEALTSPWATHRHFDRRPCPGSGDGEFEPCLGGVGNLNENCEVFPVEYTYFIFWYGDFKGKKLTFENRWRMAKTPQESHGRWSCLLQKVDHRNRSLGRHLREGCPGGNAKASNILCTRYSYNNLTLISKCNYLASVGHTALFVTPKK